MRSDSVTNVNDERRDARIRAFVTVIPPADVLNRLTVSVARLRPLAPWKWAEPAQLHLTLRFLGEAPVSRIERLADALSEFDAGNAFDARLSRVGGFPDLASPRALWLGTDTGTRELTNLAERVEKTAVDTGFTAELRSFAPHLTLARRRSAGPVPPALSVALASPPSPSFSWRCDRFFLVRSRLTPGGPIYTTLKEYIMA
jgi:2'-5' RNA ligase